jgi:hypothetical protein
MNGGPRAVYERPAFWQSRWGRAGELPVEVTLGTKRIYSCPNNSCLQSHAAARGKINEQWLQGSPEGQALAGQIAHSTS